MLIWHALYQQTHLLSSGNPSLDRISCTVDKQDQLSKGWEGAQNSTRTVDTAPPKRSMERKGIAMWVVLLTDPQGSRVTRRGRPFGEE